MTPPDNKPIPLLDLQAQYDSIANKLEVAALGLMRSGQYIMGEAVAQLRVGHCRLSRRGACPWLRFGFRCIVTCSDGLGYWSR